MKLKAKLHEFIYIDSYVAEHRKKETLQTQQRIALIGAIGFFIMSILNIKQNSYMMLITTCGGSLLFFVGLLVSKVRDSGLFLRGTFYTVLLVVFPIYTLSGGNEGFAALWLILITYLAMHCIDFKVGFFINLFYLAMLLLTFVGPLSFLVTFDYGPTFRLRFPFLFAINFAFATYIVASIRVYQYKLLLNQKKLQEMSILDLNTDVLNRNGFIQFERSFLPDGLNSLSAVYIDANGLHELNNRCGHDAGDRMLRTVAKLAKKFFPYASVYRMGGDEFLIICQNIEEAKIINDVHSLSNEIDKEGYSISFGVDYQKEDFDLHDIVKRANSKMLAYKANYYCTIGQDRRHREIN